MNTHKPSRKRSDEGRCDLEVLKKRAAVRLRLLVVLSMASELEALPIHLSALVVLVHMVAGFAIGWLIQPVIKALFPQ